MNIESGPTKVEICRWIHYATPNFAFAGVLVTFLTPIHTLSLVFIRSLPLTLSGASRRVKARSGLTCWFLCGCAKSCTTVSDSDALSFRESDPSNSCDIKQLPR